MSRCSRPALILGSGAWALAATAYFYLAYRIVFVMRIGPTAVVVDSDAGMGAHTGDVLALPLSLAAVVCVALAISWAHRAASRPVLTVVRPRALESVPGLAAAA